MGTIHQWVKVEKQDQRAEIQPSLAQLNKLQSCGTLSLLTANLFLFTLAPTFFPSPFQRQKHESKTTYNPTEKTKLKRRDQKRRDGERERDPALPPHQPAGISTRPRVASGGAMDHEPKCCTDHLTCNTSSPASYYSPTFNHSFPENITDRKLIDME